MFLRYLAKQSADDVPTEKVNIISGNNKIIKTGGNYKIAQDFTGTITINTTDAVTIDGEGKTFSDVNIRTASTTADLTIKDLNITEKSKSIIKFGDGANNKLNVGGCNNLINSGNYANINVGGGLTIDGNGYLEVEIKAGSNGAANNGSIGDITINGDIVSNYWQW